MVTLRGVLITLILHFMDMVDLVVGEGVAEGVVSPSRTVGEAS